MIEQLPGPTTDHPAVLAYLRGEIEVWELEAHLDADMPHWFDGAAFPPPGPRPEWIDWDIARMAEEKNENR